MCCGIALDLCRASAHSLCCPDYPRDRNFIRRARTLLLQLETDLRMLQLLLLLLLLRMHAAAVLSSCSALLWQRSAPLCTFSLFL